MNNKEFIARLSLKTGMNTKLSQSLVDQLITAMGDHFQDGDSLSVPNFGNFEVKKKMERVIMNPVTAQRMLVPPKLVLAFKPSTVWKDKVRNAGNTELQKGGEA